MDNARSFNGRMSASEAEREGSTPSLAVKFCNQCKTDKSTKEFGKRGKGLQPWCKNCKNEWDRKHYADTRTGRRKQIRDRANSIKQELQEIVIKTFNDNSCSDCGETDLLVLEFDHLGDKEFNIGQALGAGYSIKRFVAEIEKCEVVCANCHKRRTAKRANSWRYKILAGSFNG